MPAPGAAAPAGAAAPPPPAQPPAPGPPAPPPTSRICAKNLPRLADEARVRAHFSARVGRSRRPHAGRVVQEESGVDSVAVWEAGPQRVVISGDRFPPASHNQKAPDFCPATNLKPVYATMRASTAAFALCAALCAIRIVAAQVDALAQVRAAALSPSAHRLYTTPNATPQLISRSLARLTHPSSPPRSPDRDPPPTLRSLIRAANSSPTSPP
jgi:hypothetical protein